MIRCGFGRFVLAQAAGPTLHLYRKLASSQLIPHSAIAKFSGLQDLEVRRFLVRLLQDSGDNLDSEHVLEGSIRK